MKLDIKQAGAVGVLVVASCAAWWSAVKMGLPHEYVDPVVFAALGLAAGALKSYVLPAKGGAS